MWFWVLNGYAHLDPFYGILLNFGCNFKSMVPNTHCGAYNEGLSASSVHIPWKSFLIKVHMVSLLSSISFRCNLQQSQLLHWISNKFCIDMHVCLLSQWDFHLQVSFLPGSVPPNIRPYRHLFHHKIEIEMLIRDLQKQGIILPSTNSFASPVPLV